ncbi:AI-2E family transporter [Pedobacter endophyticus]|uniref:AI-2E family transporter n=1 Tax=Pedobacter endophyticus TaxID=2789740 RepID=A0A7S9PZQ5_9SPHI|nr:AI-2E family transporter [Pedobacter endophyticus]QPH40598.1 AI-2E family transporter [Pedobacter endophyticus]
MNEQQESTGEYGYVKKVWIAVGIVALIISLLLILTATFGVILVIFAGILLAVFFRGCTGMLNRWTKWNEKLCVFISIVFVLALVVGFFWLVGSQIETQIAELSDTLPKTIENLKSRLGNSNLGNKVMDRISSEDSEKKIQAFATGFFTSTFGGFGDIYVVVFIGLFITVSPELYIEGIIELAPRKARQGTRDLFFSLGEQLRKWIKGKLLSMFVVFILTAIGLWILGIPLWLVLAMIAGILSFIPNFGPIAALIPAVLVALLQSPQTALWVTGMYIVIQFIESNFITTLIQQKMVNIPPALIISAQMMLGALTGSWGLVLSTPLTVVVIVLIKHLYINRREKND